MQNIQIDVFCTEHVKMKESKVKMFKNQVEIVENDRKLPHKYVNIFFCTLCLPCKATRTITEIETWQRFQVLS